MQFVEAHRNTRVRLMVHVIMKLQFHIIGRADDLTNLRRGTSEVIRYSQCSRYSTDEGDVEQERPGGAGLS